MAESYSVKAVLSAVDKNFSSTFSSAQKSISGISDGVNKATGAISRIAAGIGVFKALSAGANLLSSSVSSAFSRQDTMEQFNRTITTITGNANAASGALEELKGITKGTAYGLDAAAKATQNFVTRGMSLESATKSVGAWADAVAFYGKGTNEQLEMVADAIGKMRTKGTVEMDQLNRLFDVGIDAVGMYAKAVGRDSASVQDDLSKGKIRADEFLSTVETAMMEGTNGVQKISGAAKEAGASWSGTFDNMRAAVTRGTLSIINAVDEMLKKNGFPTMRESIKKFGDTAESVLNNVADGIKNLSNVGALLPQLGATLAGAVVMSGGMPLLDLLPGTLDAATAGAEKLKTGIGKVSNETDFFERRLDKIAKKSGKTKNALKKDVMEAANVYKSSGMSMSDAMKKAYKDIGVSSGNPVQRMVSGMKASLSSLTGKVTAAPKQLAGNFKTMLSNAGQIATSLPGPFGKAFEKIGGFGDKATTRMKAVQGKLVSAASGMQGKMKGMFDFGSESPLAGLQRYASKISGNLKAIGTAAGNSAKIGVSGLGKLGSALNTVFGLAMKTVGPAAIVGVALAGMGVLQTQFGTQINEMLKMATQNGPQIIQNLTQGIVSSIPTLISAGTELLVNLLNAITANLPAIMSAGLQIIAALVQGLISNLPTILPAAVNAIATFVMGIITMIPQIILLGIQVLQAFVEGIQSQDIGATILTVLNHLITTIVTFLPQMITAGMDLLASIANGIINNLPAIITAAFQLMLSFIAGIASMLPDIVQKGWDIIKNLALGIVNAIPEVLCSVFDGIADLFGGLWDKITGKTDEGSEKVKEKTQEMAESVQANTSATTETATLNATQMAESVQAAFDGMSTGATSATDSMLAGVTGSLSGISSTGAANMNDLASNVVSSASTANASASGDYQAMANNVNSAMSSINTSAASGLANTATSFESTFSKIESTVSTKMNNIQNKVRAGMTTFTAAIRAGMTLSKAVCVTGVNGIVSTFSGLSSRLYSMGLFAMAGLRNGLVAGSGSVYATAAGIANRVATTISSALKIGSPSKVLEKIGAWGSEGLGNGLLKMLPYVEKASKKLANAATPVLAADFGGTRMQYSFAGYGSLNMAYQDDGSSIVAELQNIREKLDEVKERTIHLETRVDMDGREVGYGTARYVQEKNNNDAKVRKYITGKR